VSLSVSVSVPVRVLVSVSVCVSVSVSVSVSVRVSVSVYVGRSVGCSVLGRSIEISTRTKERTNERTKGYKQRDHPLLSPWLHDPKNFFVGMEEENRREMKLCLSVIVRTPSALIDCQRVTSLINSITIQGGGIYEETAEEEVTASGSKG